MFTILMATESECAYLFEDKTHEEQVDKVNYILREQGEYDVAIETGKVNAMNDIVNDMNQYYQMGTESANGVRVRGTSGVKNSIESEGGTIPIYKRLNHLVTQSDDNNTELKDSNVLVEQSNLDSVVWGIIAVGLVIAGLSSLV